MGLHILEENIMSKTIISNNPITLQKLGKEIDSVRKKLFIYETLQSEKEIKHNKVKGPFKNGKEIINHVKN